MSKQGLRGLGPGVRFPPPLPFVVAFGLGFLLDRFAPLPLRLPTFGSVGLALCVAGAALLLTGMVTFRVADTPVYPNRPARRLVTQGVYAFTRNPMYLGLIVCYMGGVALTGFGWSLLLLPLVVLVVTVLVIRREERHLLTAFPTEYVAYCSQVRRWL